MIRNKNFDNNGLLLYLVATPIGNLGEFSKRAIEVVSNCDIVAAEDTRNSKDLLSKFNIFKEMFSLREHNEVEASLSLINKIKGGKKVCYMSDAGYPCISDPGFILVKKCLENGIKVSTISGSSAGINALVASGIDSSHFYFYGFLSAKESEAKKELEELKEFKDTIIFYESPHRIIDTLSLLYFAFGDRKFALARELTKLNEEYIYGSLSEIKEIDQESLKGEMVIIVEGNKKEKEIDLNLVNERINYFKTKGLTNKDISEIISYEFPLGKNAIKDLINKK